MGRVATYLAFLRAVNLGPTRKFPKDDIRRVVEDAGFENVDTHINSGNLRFDTRMRALPRIEEKLETAFAADRGFDVPTIVFSATEFRDLAADAETLNAEHQGVSRHYIYLLKEEPSAADTARIEATASDAGEMIVRGRAAHALLGPSYENGNVDPLGAAKLLGVATNRNLNVVTTLARKWC